MNGMPSRSQNGRSMGESFAQQAAHKPFGLADHLPAGGAERRQRDIEGEPQRGAQRPGGAA